MLVSSCATLSDLQELQSGKNSSGHIVKGVEISDQSDYGKRSVLLVMEKSSGTSICTAVPIGARLLLTAAHCVHQMEPAKIKAVFGHDYRNLKDSKTPSVEVEKYKVHELFDGSAKSYSDLALIKLKSAIPKDYKVVPTYDGKSETYSDQLTLVGYGITEENNKDSLLLRMTTKSYKNDVYLKDSLIGFNQKNETGGFCKGDSGAPIFMKVGATIKLLAINSFTAGPEAALDCHSASFAMYIPFFRAWIIKESIHI